MQLRANVAGSRGQLTIRNLIEISLDKEIGIKK
jgi:hypothetical protein